VLLRNLSTNRNEIVYLFLNCEKSSKYYSDIYLHCHLRIQELHTCLNQEKNLD
jgi:hypothetical protein